MYGIIPTIAIFFPTSYLFGGSEGSAVGVIVSLLILGYLPTSMFINSLKPNYLFSKTQGRRAAITVGVNLLVISPWILFFILR
jgi:hypothetical protein